MSQINLWSMCTVTCGDLEKILHLEEEGTFCLLLMITPEECRLKFLNQTIKHLIDLRNGTLKLQIRRNLSRSILELIMDWSSYLKKFTAFCKSKGVTRHLTVRGTPQQNGVAERMNGRLLERVRCMLLNAGLPKGF